MPAPVKKPGLSIGYPTPAWISFVSSALFLVTTLWYVTKDPGAPGIGFNPCLFKWRPKADTPAWARVDSGV